MNLRQPMHPFVQNTLILVTSGIVASLVCAKVYGATLPVEEPTAPAPIATVAPAPAQAADPEPGSMSAFRLSTELSRLPVLADVLRAEPAVSRVAGSNKEGPASMVSGPSAVTSQPASTPQAAAEAQPAMLLKAASQAARAAGCNDLELAAASDGHALAAFCLATGFAEAGPRFVRSLRKQR